MVDRVFEAGAQLNPPSPPASPSSGYPTNGDPVVGTPPTEPGEWWFHMVTEELRAIVAAAGLTPDHTNVTQLLAALQKLEVVGNIGQKSLTATGYILLPGGLIVQWGRNRSTAGAATPVVFPTAFPNQAFIVVTSHGNVSSVDNNAIGINLTLTGFDLWVFRTDGTSGDSIAADWIAIGI